MKRKLFLILALAITAVSGTLVGCATTSGETAMSCDSGHFYANLGKGDQYCGS